MTGERVQIIVEAKDAFSGVFRGLTGQLGAVGNIIQELTVKNINWGNVTQWAAAAVIDGLKKAVNETVKYASEVRQLSMLSGMSTEESSRFIQVLDDYKLTAADALVATRSLTAQGYAPNISTLKSLSDQYLQLNTVEEKNAFILKNLGRGGTEWAEILQLGSTRLQELNDNVDENLVLTLEQANAAREYEFALDNVKDAWQGLEIEAGTKLIPALTKLLDISIPLAKAWANIWIGKWIEAGGNAVDIIKILTDETDGATLSFDNLGQTTLTANEAVTKFGDGTREGTAALEAYVTAMLEGKDETEATTLALKTYNDVLANTEKAWKAVTAAAIAGNLGKAIEDAGPNLKQYSANIEYYQGLLKQGPGVLDYYAQKVDDVAAAYGEGSEQYEAAKKQLEDVTADYKNAGGAIDYYKGKIQEQNDAIDKAIEKQIYQQASGILTADQQLELGRSLGRVSEEDYALAASVQTLTDQYDQNADGAIDNAARSEEYRQKVQDVNDAVQWAIDHNKPITQEFIFQWVTDKQNAEDTAKQAFQNAAAQLGSVDYRPTVTPVIDETAETDTETKLNNLIAIANSLSEPQTINIKTEDAKKSIGEVETWINNLPSSHDVYLNMIYPPGWTGGGLPQESTGYATGTNYVSGMFMAGEGGGGAEYIYAPGGATVFNPKQTRAMQDELSRMRPMEQHNNFYGPTTLVVESEESVESLMVVR